MAIENNSLIYWIWLSQLIGIGPATAKKLLNVFITPENIYKGSRNELISVHGISNDTADLILVSKSLKEAENILNKCEKLNIKILAFQDDLYKQEIRNIKNSPVLLYYKGTMRVDNLGIAIVGSRRCSEYGKRVAIEAAEILAYNNIPIISGMAKGIDGYSHTACLKAGGYTIAILGCGLDICYPKEHDTLMQKIIEHGVAISEYPPGIKPNYQNFPERNRLISAWCKKLLVVEASENSGALITASFATEQNRQVLAVPHNIYSSEGKGANKLIEMGAKIYLSPNQLLDGFEIRIKNKNLSVEHYNTDLKPLEDTIIKKIKENFMNLNELLLVLEEDKQKVLETVSIMEIEGKLCSVGGILKCCV